jgi:hypothetical protein
MAAGDVDGDGDIDLVTTGVANDVALYLNNGAGSFSFPFRMGAIAGAHALLYRDFTGDGVADLAVLSSPAPLGFDGGIAVIRGTNAAPVALSAVSRKAHGAAGMFDVNLPLTGTPAIECRSGGTTNDHTLVITFGGNVSVNGAAQAEIVSGTGTIGSGGNSNGGAVFVNGRTVTVPLTNVGNAQTIQVRLNGVSDGGGVGSPVVSMRVLAGDVNGNGSVTSSDLGSAKAEANAPLTATNFRADVTPNGTINASDVAFVKAASGSSVP